MKTEPRRDTLAITHPASYWCGRRPPEERSGNRHKCLFILAAITVALSTGCSAKLTVAEQLATNSGLPIRADVPVIVTTTTQFRALPVDQVNRMLPSTQHKSQAEADALCERPDIKEALALAPLGKLYFLNIDPAELAKNEFHVEWADNGRLKKVSMNSDPSASIKESAAALETLLPFVGVTAETPAAAAGTTKSTAGFNQPFFAEGLVATKSEPLPAARAKAIFCAEVSSSITTRPLPSS